MIVDEFVNSRSKEIKEIEKSIETKKKQSLIWQRLPHYKRRRNRNYDKRHTKKVKPRKKDRHVLRTHTYFAKRFFMLKLKDKLSIPLNRRVKSDKFIYKFSLRLLVFDESFRGVFEYKRDEQTIEENSDLIVVGDKIISIGKQLNKELIDSKLCSFVLMVKILI
ncbi:hypothetical protein A0H76_2564 [Hepatospora eriocheir]|uniref:Pop1 N-terminal domain-containing protein n=1 Tax=Hepatospora eriocheir TaxID=1081669 RepID=A0A1X0QJM7_9MICR|nr:hypothetical protein A0H76_2564 [Hepatospora eriocheir]